MAKIHLVLQAKGGVGKSFISSMLAQYKLSNGHAPLCVDTDPMNATFTGYQALGVRKLSLLNGDEIDARNFDTLLEWLVELEQDAIVDNGAATFVPLVNYLIINETPSLLAEMGHELVIHTVVTGGQALLDTVNGFSQLISQFPDPATFVVWLNPYWGPIEADGKTFRQFKGYEENENRIAAIITIPAMQAATFGRDVEDILKERLTFGEALDSPARSVAVRQRLKIYRRALFAEMDAAKVL
jgi:hypothetical protein